MSPKTETPTRGGMPRVLGAAILAALASTSGRALHMTLPCWHLKLPIGDRDVDFRIYFSPADAWGGPR